MNSDGMGMRLYKSAYVGAILLAGFGGVVAAALVHPDSALMALAFSQEMLAVLTFPLGFVASAIGFVLIYMGIVTPAEAIFLMTPLYAVLGYLQWFRLLPAFYRRGR